jgi:hypothetical protein
MRLWAWPLYLQGTSTGSHSFWSWLGPRTGLDALEGAKLTVFWRKSEHNSSVIQHAAQSLYRLSYPGIYFKKVCLVNMPFCISHLHTIYTYYLRPLDCWDSGFESRWGHVCSSLVLAVCCVGSSLCDKLIALSEESYWVCVSNCVWYI